MNTNQLQAAGRLAEVLDSWWETEENDFAFDTPWTSEGHWPLEARQIVERLLCAAEAQAEMRANEGEGL